MKRLLWGIVVLLLGAVSVSAQSDAPYEVVLYVQSSDANGGFTGEVRILQSDGSSQSIALPAALYREPNLIVTQVKISPDRRYLAMAYQIVNSDIAPPVAIADLETGACCVYVSPSGLEDIGAYQLAGFDPNGSVLALSYVGFLDRQTYDVRGGLMTVDGATGDILLDLPMETVNQAFPGDEFGGVWALMGPWRSDGVRFVPSCYACEPPIEGYYSIWYPTSSDFGVAAGEPFSFFFGEYLPSTGEMLYTSLDFNYPSLGEAAFGLFPIPNVVNYLTTNAVAAQAYDFGTTTEPVVFYNPSAVEVQQVEWVEDGAAFVAVTGDNAGGVFWNYVRRDGTVLPLPATLDDRLMTGTPDGWLTLAPTGAMEQNVPVLRPVLNRVAGTSLSVLPVGDPLPAGAVVDVIDAPDLGLRLDNPNPFPPVVAPTQGDLATLQAPFATVCPGFLPSRLLVGQPARVTPGDPNRIRADASINSQVVGEIPGGAVFLVISGPQCDATQPIAWWLVEYNGIQGWTAEGSGGVYFTEPTF